MIAKACLVFVCLVLASQCAPSGPARAPQMAAHPANQLSIAGNACGPTALLNALRFGNPADQQVAAAIPGDTDRSKLRHMIIRYGTKASSHIPLRKRWSRRGINAADLTDVTNEIAPLSPRVRMIIPRDPEGVFQTHEAIARSLRRGFPPIVGIRRYEGAKTIDSHFITIIELPEAITADAQEFRFSYIDPLGGKKCQGTIHTRHHQQFTDLIAVMPQTSVGASRASRDSYLKMDSLIVR